MLRWREKGPEGVKGMRVLIELVFLILGAIMLAFSIKQRRLPRGVLDRAVWILDILILSLRFIGR